MIRQGMVFDTRFENGCLALSDPDEFGFFEGMDSDGVICNYDLQMVEKIY